MDTTSVFLFPIETAKNNPDRLNDIIVFEVVDIRAGSFLGFVGERLPADEEKGYDAVFGWQTPMQVRSTTPYRSLTEATDALVVEALSNGDVEGEEI